MTKRLFPDSLWLILTVVSQIIMLIHKICSNLVTHYESWHFESRIKYHGIHLLHSLQYADQWSYFLSLSREHIIYTHINKQLMSTYPSNTLCGHSPLSITSSCIFWVNSLTLSLGSKIRRISTPPSLGTANGVLDSSTSSMVSTGFVYDGSIRSAAYTDLVIH